MKDRAYRISQDKRIIKKRLRLVKRTESKIPDSTGKTHYDHLTEAPGKLRKRHPMDCGNPKCLLCHLGKLLKEKKPSDKRKEEKIKAEVIHEHLHNVKKSHRSISDGWDDYSTD